MDEVIAKYPYADAEKVKRFWDAFQYAQQGQSFLEYYEKRTTT